MESIAIARFQTPKRDPKANIPAPGTNMLASETGNLTPHKSGSPYPIPEKVPKSSKDEINQEITTKGDGDKPDKTNIKITPSKQRAMDGIGNISSQDKRNKITSSPIMKSAEMKSAETKNVIGLLNRESSSYGSYSEILRYGEPIRPVDYYSEDITLPCPLMKLSGSLEEERNCPHLHLVQGEYEYSLSLLSKNPLYINAILLRMKLLGMVVAIKREIVDFMASQHKKHSEFTDDKTKGNWDRAYNFLGAFHDVMINDNTGWRKKLYLKNWRVTWYWIENMIGVKLGEDNIKSFMFWLSLILIVMVIGTGCVYLTNHDTCLFKLPFSEYQINIVDAAAAFSAGFISLYIFVVGFNFQSIEDREAFHQHDQFNEMLNEARARLTQFNLSVQTGNTAADEKIIYANLPEEFIREINTVMQIKEAVGSLDSVIKARMNCVGAKVRELRAEKQKSRRMVMAAGGAIFTGFFAHEVGMSVLEYNHLKNNADPLTFLNSLGVGKGSQIPHFEHTLFHKEALDGTGWVLLITLIFTVAAAILASRRPSEEGYNSEHGEHH